MLTLKAWRANLQLQHQQQRSEPEASARQVDSFPQSNENSPQPRLQTILSAQPLVTPPEEINTQE